MNKKQLEELANEIAEELVGLVGKSSDLLEQIKLLQDDNELRCPYCGSDQIYHRKESQGRLNYHCIECDMEWERFRLEKI